MLGLWHEIANRWADFRIEPEEWLEGDGVVLMLGRLVARGVGSGVPVSDTWDQVWWVEGELPTRCENHTDRARAYRAAGIDA